MKNQKKTDKAIKQLARVISRVDDRFAIKELARIKKKYPEQESSFLMKTAENVIDEVSDKFGSSDVHNENIVSLSDRITKFTSFFKK